MAHPQARVAVITGAPSGVGFNFTVKLLRSGAYGRIILAVRNAARGEDTIARLRAEAAAAPASGAAPAAEPAGVPAADVEITALPCDLASLASVRAFTLKVAEIAPEVHLLVLNAGLTAGPLFQPTQVLSADGLEMTFAVNHLAHWLMATDLVPQLRAAATGPHGPIARIVVTASIAHTTASLPSAKKGGWRTVTKLGTSSNITAYSNSKLANVMMAYDLERRYGAEGIVVVSMHPGAIRDTNFWQGQAGFTTTLIDCLVFPLARMVGNAVTVAQGGDALLLATRATEGGRGRFLDITRWKPTSRTSRDLALTQELWDLSAELVAAALAATSGTPQAS